jgi:hypothetical protein
LAEDFLLVHSIGEQLHRIGPAVAGRRLGHWQILGGESRKVEILCA